MASRTHRVLLAALALAAWAHAGHDGSLATAADLARLRWKAPFRGLAPIQSPRLRAILGDCPVYRATVLNPVAAIAGRPTFLHTLVLRPGGPAFIERDEDAAALLTQCRRPVADAAAALALAVAFGELRNYTLEARPRAVDPKPRSEDWIIVIQATRDGWSIACTFLVDPNITLCRRYRLTITRSGKLTAQAARTVLMTDGYD